MDRQARRWRDLDCAQKNPATVIFITVAGFLRMSGP